MARARAPKPGTTCLPWRVAVARLLALVLLVTSVAFHPALAGAAPPATCCAAVAAAGDTSSAPAEDASDLALLQHGHSCACHPSARPVADGEPGLVRTAAPVHRARASEAPPRLLLTLLPLRPPRF